MLKNENGEEMEEHHIHYKEIDGYDETVFLTRSEHKLLHMRLRREGKCNIPSKDLHKISNVARARTEKAQKWQEEWNEKNPEYQRKYYQQNKERIDEVHRIYRENNKEKINKQCAESNSHAEWVKKNPEAVKEHKRRWYAKKKELEAGQK